MPKTLKATAGSSYPRIFSCGTACISVALKKDSMPTRLNNFWIIGLQLNSLIALFNGYRNGILNYFVLAQSATVVIKTSALDSSSKFPNSSPPRQVSGSNLANLHPFCMHS